MTAHVNEYNPNSRNPTNGVQSDPNKLKFNNVKSCIAVGIVPIGGNQLIGVHFTVLSTRNDQEVDTALATVRTLLGGSACEVYLVAAWGHHATTTLLKKLKNLASRIYLIDVEKNDAGEADVDVMMEKNGPAVTLSVREHAVFLTDTNGRRMLKPKYTTPGSIPRNIVQTGRSAYQSDRDSKPWIRAQPMQIHPAS